jgi:hypothetical protein
VMTTTAPSGDEVTRERTRRRRAEIACVSGIAFKTIFALVLLPLTPSLLGTDPVLLEALRGSTSGMASAGAFARVGEASLVLAILAPLPTLIFATPFFWWAGRLWGPKAAATLGGGHPNAEKWAQRSGAYLERFGGLTVTVAPFLPIPASFVYAAAGWTGMTLRRFFVLCGHPHSTNYANTSAMRRERRGGWGGAVSVGFLAWARRSRIGIVSRGCRGKRGGHRLGCNGRASRSVGSVAPAPVL